MVLFLASAIKSKRAIACAIALFDFYYNYLN